MKASLARHSRQIILEVERKFKCFPDTLKSIHGNRGHPPFRSLNYLGRQSFNDRYFDKDAILSSNGVWIRRRDGLWQAKVRQGGDFTHSSFEELSGINRIRSLLSTYNIPVQVGEDTLGLREIARFTTTRDRWKADEAFEIAVDTTDFGHTVGEVELQSTANAGRENIGALSDQMDEQIKAFMERYTWALPSGKVVGKLSAYFKQRQ